MSTIAVKTGGPAFPMVIKDTPQYSGMHLRDYFAAAALKGLASNSAVLKDPGDMSKYARQAYKLADAMLAAKLEEHS